MPPRMFPSWEEPANDNQETIESLERRAKAEREHVEKWPECFDREERLRRAALYEQTIKQMKGQI